VRRWPRQRAIALRPIGVICHPTSTSVDTERGCYVGCMSAPSGPRRPVTFINVFTVEPANQQRLVDILTHVTAE
jgi:hypothetical protein